jgi:hypothetical protein
MATHQAMMTAMSVFRDRPTESAATGRNPRDMIIPTQTVILASIGFLQAHDPQTSAQVHASRDPDWMKNRELSELERLPWDAAFADLRRLETNDDSAQSLLMQPLWLTPAPPQVRDDWTRLSARLLARADEHWGVWTDWYEARLAGGAQVSEEIEVARVSLPEEDWDRGPAFANARILALAGTVMPGADQSGSP